jgi:hypothetical protein
MADYSLPIHCTLVAGCSSSGKTTFAWRHMVNADGVTCRFVFDYKGEFLTRWGMSAASTALELEKALATRWVIFNPHRMFPGNAKAAFIFFCQWVFTASQRGPGRKIFYVDEAWKYCSPNSIPEALAVIVQTGRSEGIETFFMTQRPNRLNEAILNEVTEYVCFALDGRNAIQTAIDYGIPADLPPNLPKGTFYALDERGRSVRHKLFDPPT